MPKGYVGKVKKEEGRAARAKKVAKRIISTDPPVIEVDYLMPDGTTKTVVKKEGGKRVIADERRCTATLSDTDGMIRCSQPRMKGLNVCVQHGGKARMARIKAGLEFKTPEAQGLYPSIMQRAEELARDPALLSLDDSIATRKAWIEWFAKRFTEDQIGSKDVKQLFDLYANVDSAVDAAFKMIYGERYSVSAQGVVEMAQAIINIMRRHLNTCPHCHGSLGQVANNIANAVSELLILPSAPQLEEPGKYGFVYEVGKRLE